MSIRVKTVTAIIVSLLMLILVLFFALRALLMEGFKSVEKVDTEKNVQRVVEALGAELEGIEKLVFTWTQWDDALKFAQDKNEEFIKSNLMTTAYTGAKLNFIFITDVESNIIFSGGYDFKADKTAEIPEVLKKMLVKENVLMENKDVNKTVKGLVLVDGKHLLISSGAITNSTAKAPKGGNIVFARWLDEAALEKLKATTHLSITLSNSGENTDSIIINEKDEETILGRTVMKDVFGKPSLYITVDIPRDIYQQGKKSLYSAILSLVGVGIIFIIIIILLIEMVVLRRIIFLKNEVTKRTEQFNFGELIELKGNDELSALTTSINGMLAAFSEFMNSIESK